MWIQREITLDPFPRGFHLITGRVIQDMPEIRKVKVGLLNLLLKHTSASLTLNENADPDVRKDMRKYFDKIAPENEPYYEHNSEGTDDMPAHIKSSLLGNSLTVPVTDGRLNLGVWQGIYLCEHRNRGGSRRLLLTLNSQD